MLAPDGHFIESKAPESGMREISFSDDDPDTLTILLNIAHLRFNMVPNSVDFKTLVNLAVLTDKYGAEGLLSPWLGVWMEPYITKYAPPGWEELLYVCWTFGYAETFGDLSSKLVMELGLNDEGKPVTPDKRVLDADGGLHFPPSMIGKSKKAPTSISFPDASLSTQRAKKDGQKTSWSFEKTRLTVSSSRSTRSWKSTWTLHHTTDHSPTSATEAKMSMRKDVVMHSFLVLYKSPFGKLD